MGSGEEDRLMNMDIHGNYIVPAYVISITFSFTAVAFFIIPGALSDTCACTVSYGHGEIWIRELRGSWNRKIRRGDLRSKKDELFLALVGPMHRVRPTPRRALI